MAAAGPQWDQKLLTPQQRRDILEFDKKQKEAKRLIQVAAAERQKTKAQLNGLQFKRGVLMYDSNDNIDSEIYGDNAKKEAMRVEYKDQLRMERASLLATKQSAIHLNGIITAFSSDSSLSVFFFKTRPLQHSQETFSCLTRSRRW